MLAALLLNLGSSPPIPPAAKQTFGGGPFWKKYGYDRAYDEIRVTSSTALDATTSNRFDLPALDQPRPRIARESIDYRAIDARVSESVAKDMQRLRQEVIAENEDELITIFLLLGE